MNWLSQNWLWVVVGIGLAYFLVRGRLGGHGAGHASRAPGEFQLRRYRRLEQTPAMLFP